MVFCREGLSMRVVQKALTFDDVLLVPAHSTVLPREVILATQFTRTLTLNLPLLSAAMDTVTEARLAIAIAQEGGIGIVHKNFSVKLQAAEVAKVKRFESGVVKDPITVPPDMTVRLAGARRNPGGWDRDQSRPAI
jgi:IMP dehydrogenase